MRERIIKRYSVSFKMQVISELETGRFESIEAARRHYDISGNSTIKRSLRRMVAALQGGVVGHGTLGQRSG